MGDTGSILAGTRLGRVTGSSGYCSDALHWSEWADAQPQMNHVLPVSGINEMTTIKINVHILTSSMKIISLFGLDNVFCVGGRHHLHKKALDMYDSVCMINIISPGYCLKNDGTGH